MNSYRVIRFENLVDLQREIVALIHKGWRPIGGISVDHFGRYIQAIILE